VIGRGPLRQRLFDECITAARGACLTISAGAVQRKTSAESSKDFRKHQALEFHQKAVFALQPWGDSSTRSGFYDAISAGCIPVIFESVGWRQTSLFLGRPLDEVSVLVPVRVMGPGGMGVLAFLRSLSNATVARLHDNLMALRPRTQYASQPGTPGGLDAIDVSLGLAASHFKQLAQGGNGLLATVP